MAVMPVLAQTSQDFLRKYSILVSQVGPGGVGVETLLDNWAKADQDNPDMLTAKYTCYLTKAQSTEIVTSPNKRYLGLDPVLSLADSTGAAVYYYQVLAYDDELFGEAIKAMDRAADVYPERFDFRFMKVNAYVSYERESPDMALSCLVDLVEEYAEGDLEWTYEGEKTDEMFFIDAMQELTECWTAKNLLSHWFIGHNERLVELTQSNHYLGLSGHLCLISHDGRKGLA